MKRFLALASVLLLGSAVAALLVVFGARDVRIVRQDGAETTNMPVGDRAPAAEERALPQSPLTGLYCKNASRRPLAVMLSADPITRPLSGIAEADVVVEMPVTMNQVTRFMALYQCGRPRELGSIRSARHDFLPLAAGFDALYGHWGGSHFALEKLRRGVLDNIDALINPYDVYWRKRGIPGPHDGFTSYERLWQTAGKLGYRTALGRGGYPPRRAQASADSVPAAVIAVAYNENGFAVRWQYDAQVNAYKRFRAGKAEIDKNTGQQVEANVVLVMKTTQKFLEDQYTDVAVIGNGRATIYQQGGALSARWEKKDFSAPLRFVDENGDDAPLVAGKRWIEIVTR